VEQDVALKGGNGAPSDVVKGKKWSSFQMVKSVSCQSEKKLSSFVRISVSLTKEKTSSLVNERVKLDCNTT
jgi:hypothetical protein